MPIIIIEFNLLFLGVYMKKITSNVAILTALTFIHCSNITTAIADDVAGGEVGNPVGKALCEVRLDDELFGGAKKSYMEKYKKLLLNKGYTITTETKKGTYALMAGSNAGCFSGLILGHTCLASLRLDYNVGDYASSGLKIIHSPHKSNTLAYAHYDSYSLFFKPKLEDIMVELLETKLITCEEAKKSKDNKKGYDFMTDMFALESACEKNEPIDLNTYNYYVGQLEKYKIKPDIYADNPTGQNNVERLGYILKKCPSISDKIKMVNSMNDSSRTIPSSVSKDNDGTKAEKGTGASK